MKGRIKKKNKQYLGHHKCFHKYTSQEDLDKTKHFIAVLNLRLRFVKMIFFFLYGAVNASSFQFNVSSFLILYIRLSFLQMVYCAFIIIIQMRNTRQ